MNAQNKKSRFWFGVVLVAALTVLPGCNQCSSGRVSVSDSSAPTNDQLVLAMSQEFENLNPILQQMLATSYLNGFVIHSINWINKDWEWECALCIKMPSLENGLAKIITENGVKKVVSEWEIKPKAKWGDGAPVTGHDFKLSWEVGSSPNVAVGEKTNYTRIESVTVDPENPKKFTIKHDKAYYDFYGLSDSNIGLIPSHIEAPIWEKTKNQAGAYEKQTEYAKNPLNPGLYNGPYRISEIKLGSHMVFTPNEHFYGKQPKIQKIIAKLIPNTQTMEANLFSGSVDMISILGMTFDQALTLKEKLDRDPKLAGKYKVKFEPGLVYEHVDLNLRNPLLQDVKVRKALRHGINVKELTDALFRGQQKPALHSVHPMDGYFTDNVERYPYDVAKSNALLEESGWELNKADNYRYKNGKKLTLNLMTTAQNKTREQVQVFLQAAWKKIGVHVTLKTQPARIFFGETVRKGLYSEMAMFAWISSPDNPPRSIVHSSMIPSKSNSFSGQNSGGWSNPAVDMALDSIETELDLEERKKLMVKVMQEYNKDVPTIPLYFRSDVAVIPANMKNHFVTGHQHSGPRWAQHWDLRD